MGRLKQTEEKIKQNKEAVYETQKDKEFCADVIKKEKRKKLILKHAL